MSTPPAGPASDGQAAPPAGTAASAPVPAGTGGADRPVLEVRGLAVRYGGVVALDDVTFAVGEGEVAGLIGPNGAGKTTLIDALSGFTGLSGGRISIDGRDLSGLPAHRRPEAGLVRTFQSLELFDDLTVAENVAVAASTGRRSLLRDALGRRGGEGPIDDLLSDLELTTVAHRLPTELSHGERHRAALGRALAGRPRLLLLDEPAAGLDTQETVVLANILRRLPAKGITVLLVDHDMSLVMGVCDTIHVLDFGRLIASGPPAEVREDPAVIVAYLGKAGAEP